MIKFLIRCIKKLLRDGLISSLKVSLQNIVILLERYEYKKMLDLETPKGRFSQIYNKNMWNSGESASGRGSELSHTENLRDWLIKNIPSYNVKTIVDAPCGDFNWIKFVISKFEIVYTGYDIVDELINSNKQKYGSRKIIFKQGDICHDKIDDCDLLIVRDCLFHLSFEDINNFLKNIKKTNFKYLLTTTHIVDKNFSNKNISSGDYRDIDIFSYPFYFNKSKVIDFIDDFPIGYRSPRQMILIEKKDVPTDLKK